MSDIIAKESSKFSQDAVIEMFEIDLQKLNLGIFRFTPIAVPSGSIFFGGLEYICAPIKADGFAYDGSGTLPRPTLDMMATDLQFLNLIVNLNDLVGMPVRRIKTFRKFLDDGDTPDHNVHFRTENYVIDRKAKQSRQLVSFELSMELDQQGVRLPRLMVLRDTCVHTYRYFVNREGVMGFNYQGISCPYAGNKYYSPSGEEVLDASKDVCGKRISDCKLRFGENAVLPRLAFPGVARI